MCLLLQEENGGEEHESASESEEESSSDDEQVRDTKSIFFLFYMTMTACCLILVFPLKTMFLWEKSQKRNGVHGLIEIENPNRVSQKSKKAVEVDVNAPKELTRRERYI